MAKPRRQKAEEKSAPKASTEQRVLPMQLKLGDRLGDASGEYEVIGRPDVPTGGKDVHVRVRRVDNPDVTMIRSWGAHERVAVRRDETPESAVRGPESEALIDVQRGH
jgi:hypothetical protein